jgi:hypothetical protein
VPDPHPTAIASLALHAPSRGRPGDPAMHGRLDAARAALIALLGAVVAFITDASGAVPAGVRGVGDRPDHIPTGALARPVVICTARGLPPPLPT